MKQKSNLYVNHKTVLFKALLGITLLSVNMNQQTLMSIKVIKTTEFLTYALSFLGGSLFKLVTNAH